MRGIRAKKIRKFAIQLLSNNKDLILDEEPSTGSNPRKNLERYLKRHWKKDKWISLKNELDLLLSDA